MLYCCSITHKWNYIRVDGSRFLHLSARGSVNSLQKSHWRVEGMSSCRETPVCMLSQWADASYGMRRIYLYLYIHINASFIHSYIWNRKHTHKHMHILYIYYMYSRRKVHVLVPWKRLLWTVTFCVLPALTNVCKDRADVLCCICGLMWFDGWFNVKDVIQGLAAFRIWESC